MLHRNGDGDVTMASFEWYRNHAIVFAFVKNVFHELRARCVLSVWSV